MSTDADHAEVLRRTCEEMGLPAPDMTEHQAARLSRLFIEQGGRAPARYIELVREAFGRKRP